jgi:signal transduction histidine kinase
MFFLLSLFFIIGYTIKNSYIVQEQLLTDSLKSKAIAIFDLIVDMRHWNAQYDGVYIKSEKLEPNPYLNPNSIKSANNETMVWVNPAFMTRQISDIASLRDGFKLKITSNKLINKNNAPDEDEKKILDQFDKDPNIPYSWEIKDNEFKFLGALRTEQACLSCHSAQGYKVGDIRGGISVTFDVKKEFEQLREINKDKEQTIIFLIIAAIGAIITLVIHEYTKKLNEQKISKLNESLEIKVKQLDDFNKTLHNKVKIEIEKQREKENLLIQQSKLAALGEMIGNIAHQWRQPISAVSAIMMNIKWTAISQGGDTNFLNERIKEANEQLKYMSQTIDDFRNFFKPTKEKEYFDLKVEIKKAYKILEASLQYSNINLQIYSSSVISAYGHASEFSQVVLNLISNSKDVLIERNIMEPRIEIHISQDEQNVYCEVKDNGAGIEEKYLNRIFEPYFTTKEHHGTGIGLYISKEIIEKHMQGRLSVENIENGANFIITIPIKKEEHATV